MSYTIEAPAFTKIEKIFFRRLMEEQSGCHYCAKPLEIDSLQVILRGPAPTYAEKLEDELRELRIYRSREENVPAYYIFSNRTLFDIILKMPQSDAELLGVYGFGSVKVERYGRDIIEITSQYVQQPEPDSDEVHLTCLDCSVRVEQEISVPQGLYNQIQDAGFSLGSLCNDILKQWILDRKVAASSGD